MSLELTNPNQCHYHNSRGQRCRMLCASGGDSLCPFHLRLSQAAPPDPEALAAELLDGTGNLNTADRVNALLANTVKQLVRQRIDRQDALALGYLAQLLLNSVPGVQKEYQAIRNAQARQTLRKSIAESRARLRPQPAAVAVPTPLPQRANPEPPTRRARPAVSEPAVPVAPSSTSAEPALSPQLSDEALLAVVLQATSPQRP